MARRRADRRPGAPDACPVGEAAAGRRAAAVRERGHRRREPRTRGLDPALRELPRSGWIGHPARRLGDRSDLPRAGERPGAAHRRRGGPTGPGDAGLAGRRSGGAAHRTGGRRRGGVDGVAPGRRRMSETTGPTRRSVLLTLGLALNAAAAALLAIPLVGFVLSPARRRSWQQWIALGPLAD